MAYNSREVNETKRRLSEYIAELQRTGAPHQQTLRQDIAMLLQAHGLAVERVGVLEQMLRGSAGLGVASVTGDTLADFKGHIQNGTKPT